MIVSLSESYEYINVRRDDSVILIAIV